MYAHILLEDVPRTPVRALAHRDRVHALVDPSDALAAVDVHEHCPRRRRLYARRGLLVPCDLSGLHACAETYVRDAERREWVSTRRRRILGR